MTFGQLPIRLARHSSTGTVSGDPAGSLRVGPSPSEELLQMRTYFAVGRPGTGNHERSLGLAIASRLQRAGPTIGHGRDVPADVAPWPADKRSAYAQRAP